MWLGKAGLPWDLGSLLSSQPGPCIHPLGLRASTDQGISQEASLAAQSIFPEYPRPQARAIISWAERTDSHTQRLLLVLHYKHLELSHLRLLPAQSLLRTRRHLPLTQGAPPYTALSLQTKHLWEEARQVDNAQDQLDKTWLRKEGNHLL